MCSRFFTVLPSGTGTKTIPCPRSWGGTLVKYSMSRKWGGMTATSVSDSNMVRQPSTCAHQAAWARWSWLSTTTLYQRTAIAPPRVTGAPQHGDRGGGTSTEFAADHRSGVAQFPTAGTTSGPSASSPAPVDGPDVEIGRAHV